MPPINFTDAVNAYANAGKVATQGGTSPAGGAGDSFGDMLKNAATSTIDTISKGEHVSLDAAMGKADLSKVTEAVNNAEIAVQSVVAIRDRVISAYQDIMRMPI